VPAADEKAPALRSGASDLPYWLFTLLDQTGFVEAVTMLVSRPYADPQVFACVQKILWLVCETSLNRIWVHKNPEKVQNDRTFAPI
jgi:hypothetical protein